MKSHLYSLQLLRFVAALLVVLMHTTEAMTLRIPALHDFGVWNIGSLGVDIFFVISGFVMATTAAPPAATLGQNLDNARQFMWRRIVRIVPLYWFYLVLKIALVVALPALALRSSLDFGHVLASFLFVPAMSPWGLVQPILPVGWTLNFEMLFYVVFAAAIAFRLPRAAFCTGMFALLYVAGRALPDSVALSFYAQSLLFEFVIGMLIAQHFQRRKLGAPLAAMLMLVGIALMVPGELPPWLDRFFTRGIGAALLVTGAIHLESAFEHNSFLRRLSILGDISYSTYLAHSLVVPGTVALLAALSIVNPALVIAATVAVVTLASFLSWLFLEQPMLNHFKKRRDDAPAHAHADRFIYVACPWTPLGGGMFKVADYLIQNQRQTAQHAQLLPLDTRGSASALWSLWVLTTALARLVSGRIGGRLAGVHVNMAERLSLFRKGAVIIAARLLGVPVVLHLHAAQLHHFYRKLPAPLQMLTRGFFALASHCIVLGDSAREFVTQELRVSPDKVEIVINGVPPPTVPRRIPVADAPRRVLFLGNLSERKGVSDLLHALAVPGIGRSLQVSLAGGGDIAAYQALAKELGIAGFVRFEGWADQSKAAKLMADADVLILPSYDEGLPLVILEAMANGVAVICTPVGEIPSVLEHGVNAFFVTPGDVPGIAAGLHHVLNDDPLRARLEQNGRMLYETRFSMARFFGSIAAIHRRVFGVAAAPTAATQTVSAVSGPAVSRP